MQRFENRLERMDDIERKLAQYPSGLSISYFVRLYRVNRSTIYRDFSALERRGVGLIQDGRRWKLDHRRMLYATRFRPYGLVSLYLAARLLARYSDEADPHIVKALEKLADALLAHSPLVSRHITQSAELVGDRPVRPDYAHAFEIITQAWLLSPKARVIYQGFHDQQATERLVSPYVIEPSGLGYSSYVVGYDDLRGAVRTFKLERIQSAQRTDEPFRRPDDFDPYHLFASARGIIWNQDNHEEVRLHFSRRVTRRVKESVWHPSQVIEDLPDGSCLFTVHLGSLTEITLWIRQWGADVEALAPPALRDELVVEARALATLYCLV